VVSAAQAAEHIRHLRATGSDPTFLAVSECRVIGLVAAHICKMLQYAEPVMRVTALVVDQRVRRSGTGKLLMEQAQKLAVAAGCGFVELTSAIGREEAHTFYRGIGYEANSLRFRKLVAR
jgi:GNAT superfamily N-acetyltransferase